jgi:hypothetical protein
MRRYLQAWRMHAHQRAGASRMLRLLLASTLAEAFDAWRAVAADKAHWRRVSLHYCTVAAVPACTEYLCVLADGFLLGQCGLLAVAFDDFYMVVITANLLAALTNAGVGGSTRAVQALVASTRTTSESKECA